jgi:hypothetical protein
VEYANVVIALVGPAWEGSQEGEKRRIDASNDMVRYELETAFRLKKFVIPVVVQGRKFPPEDLPASIASFGAIQAFFLDPRREFHSNVISLLAVICEHTQQFGSRGEVTNNGL